MFSPPVDIRVGVLPTIPVLRVVYNLQLTAPRKETANNRRRCSEKERLHHPLVVGLELCAACMPVLVIFVTSDLFYMLHWKRREKEQRPTGGNTGRHAVLNVAWGFVVYILSGVMELGLLLPYYDT